MKNFSISRHISMSRHICHGRPVFRGTRIPITIVLEYLAAGMTTDDILRGYPSLNRKAIQAAIRYAFLRLRDEEFIPLAKAS